MILLKRLFYFSIVLCTIVSCKKKVPDIDYPKEHYCEKFAGEYLMFDPLNNKTYNMFISCNKHESEYLDTIIIENYANKFDIKYSLGSVPGIEYRHCLIGTVIQPLIDNNGKSTSFSNNLFFNTPPTNLLRNDSLYLTFYYDNIAYYLTEGVAHEVCDPCQHYGIKIH